MVSLVPDEPLAAQRRILDAYDALAPDGRRPLDFVMSPRLYELAAGLDLNALERAVVALEQHHIGLRTCFTRTREGWRAQVAPPRTDPAVDVIDVAGRFADAEADIVDRLSARLTGWDITRGPLHRVVVVAAHDRTLVMTVRHHLVSDTWSEKILEQDLMAAYSQAAMGWQPLLAPVSTTPAVCAALEHRDRRASWDADERRWWKGCLSPFAVRPWPPPDPDRARARRQFRLVRLGPVDAATIPRLSTFDAVLAAFVSAARGWAERPVGAWVISPGRSAQESEIDLTRLVGPTFLSVPVVCEIPPGLGRFERASLVGGMWRAIPRRGRRLALRLSAWNPEEQPPFVFNYIGRGALSTLAAGSPWRPMSGIALRLPTEFHDVYFGDRTVTLTIRHDRDDLTCAIGYPGSVDDDAVTRLAARLVSELAPR